MKKDQETIFKIVGLDPSCGHYSWRDNLIGNKVTISIDTTYEMNKYSGGAHIRYVRHKKCNSYGKRGSSLYFYKVELRPTTWRGIKPL